MWQSQAPSGALSFGGSVPAEFDTCWPRLCRPIADAVAAIATIEALLMKVRRAIMSISHCPKTRGRSLDRRAPLSRRAKDGAPAPDPQEARAHSRRVRRSFSPPHGDME